MTFNFNLGAGFNPTFGRDPGPPPPGNSLAAQSIPLDSGPPPPYTTRSAQAPVIYHWTTQPSGPGIPPITYYFTINPSNPAGPVTILYCHVGYPNSSGMATAQTALAAQPAQPQAFAGVGVGLPANGIGTTWAIDANGQYYQYVSGINNSGRVPQPAPLINPDFPAGNLINSTGGVGLEPGYNYFFQTDHANVVRLMCPTEPWKLQPGTYDAIEFMPVKVPASTTMEQWFVGNGVDHPDKSLNQMWEVYPKGGGAWGWKEHIRGDDEVMMKRTVREMGWCEKRGGQLPTVYVWFWRAPPR